MLNHVGNDEILRLEKTAFFCSRHVPASIVLKSFDWAREMCRKQQCVISGNHSQIEKDVFHFLLKGKQPLILALARGLKQRIKPELEVALSNNRFVIVTPFAKTIKRITEETANKRNSMMAEMADELFVSYAQPEGIIERLVLRELRNNKKVVVFDVDENKHLLELGAKAFQNNPHSDDLY
jgi:regulator of extracellular matrix RemA (YlzA/DUF370 family)